MTVTSQVLSQVMYWNSVHVYLAHRMALEMEWTGSQVTEVVILDLQGISSVTLEKSLALVSVSLYENKKNTILLLGLGEAYRCIKKQT